MKADTLFDLTGQVALVTGASSGLGLRFAEVLAANGAKVVLVARRADRLADVKQKIEKAGGKAIAVEADVLDRDNMRHAFDAAEKAFGTVTILLNNAGIAHTDRAIDLSEETWKQVMAIDLDAVFFWSQEAARRLMAASKQGAIVNIASVVGFNVSKGIAAYAVAKAGVVQITKALALEWATRGIRVNGIAPGWFTTDINRDFLASERGQAIRREIPMERFGEDGDLDGSLLLLVSRAGRFMTGETVLVDGGQSVALRG
jgi:3-oxoacyl-[acyl-carrier protein] reductase